MTYSFKSFLKLKRLADFRSSIAWKYDSIHYRAYNVIILQDLRLRPSTRKRSVSVFKKVTLGIVFKTCVSGAQKRRLLLDGEKILVLKMRAVQSRLLNTGLVLFKSNSMQILSTKVRQGSKNKNRSSFAY